MHLNNTLLGSFQWTEVTAIQRIPFYSAVHYFCKTICYSTVNNSWWLLLFHLGEVTNEGHCDMAKPILC